MVWGLLSLSLFPFPLSNLSNLDRDRVYVCGPLTLNIEQVPASLDRFTAQSYCTQKGTIHIVGATALADVAARRYVEYSDNVSFQAA
jgi:hypothetical protein